MQCIIDATELASIRPAFWENLQFDLLRHGFDNILMLAHPNIFPNELPHFHHPDLPHSNLQILESANPLTAISSGTFFPEDAFLYLNATRLAVFNWLSLASRDMTGVPVIKAECNNDDNHGAAFWLRRDFLYHMVAPGRESLYETLCNVDAEKISVTGKIWGAETFSGNALIRKGAVFLDRDGVLNRDKGYVHLWEDWEWIPGAKESIKAMNDAGYFVFVATNQSGVARGYYPEEEVLKLHSAVQEDLLKIGAHIDSFRYCPWLDNAPLPQYRKKSDWRKPGAGMLEDICKFWPVNINQSFMVGDKESDIAAGKAMGMSTFLFSGSKLDLRAITGKIYPTRSQAH